MFWVIGTNTEPKISQPNQADLDRFEANKAMKGETKRTLYQYRLADVQAPLPAPDLSASEAIYVAAHAGLNPNPWIAGLVLDGFADAMHTKFGAAGLSHRTIWMLVCQVGTSVQAFAARLAHHGVRDTTIYIPADYMYISSKGIPHILRHVTDPEAADKMVASFDSEFPVIANSEGTGVGWAGATIDAAGQVAAINAGTVEDAVIARFDPDRTEVED